MELLAPQSTIFFIVGILFFSTLTRSTFGFGDALLAMPLITLLTNVQTATPLVAFGATTIAAVILMKNWRIVDLRAAWRLILSALAGIPLGLYLLTELPERWVQGVLAGVLVLFASYNLLQRRLVRLENEQWAYVFGFVGGVLGGAYNTNGPPAVVYGTLRNWPPDRFRATMQGYFFPTGSMIMVGHGLEGLWTPSVIQLYVFAFPCVLFAIFLGGVLNHRISPKRFEKFIYLILLLLGIMLFVQISN